MYILNIAGGKIGPLMLSSDLGGIPKYILNVDKSYYSEVKPSDVEADMIEWGEDGDRVTKTVCLNSDIFEFMERTCLQFERVTIYRFLEHVSFVQVPYFIYLVSTVLRQGGLVDVIVPNYKALANRIMDEEITVANNDFGKYNSFEGWDIELTTELLNEPSSPHASIWTVYRAKKFWEMEKRFEIVDDKTVNRFQFDGRDIYLRFIARRL